MYTFNSPFVKAFQFVLILSLVFTACKKDEDSDSNTRKGRFSGDMSCKVVSPPDGSDLDKRYTKFINCIGVPVIGSAKVSDLALTETAEIIEFVLSGTGTLKTKLIEQDAFYILVGGDEELTDLPEMSHVSAPGDGYTTNQRGDLVCASREDEVLCDSNSRGWGQSVVVHELGHLIHFGVLIEDDEFQSALESAYKAAKDGAWKNTFSTTNDKEYWATGVAAWYGLNPEGPKGGNGIANEIIDKQTLKEKDKSLYDLLDAHLNDRTDFPGCVD